MARRTTPPPPPDDFTEQIVDIDVEQEMQGAFLEYAYSVIYSRALPDARDGMKPVQRRILFTMSEMGLRPDRAHVKCGRIVGDVMGKLHPHGDGAIYDALVRMAQDFTMRLPLVDGHGNFGSLDDGPAAYRYTEARLAHAALLMTETLDEDTVEFVPNYDSQLTQPEVLPAAFPNLLVNGAAGIAVGMATNMPPHNLVEVVGAARHLLANPDATLDDLMKFVPGPDLPTGGKIVGLDGIRDAYAGGRGTFRTRATTRIENITPRRQGIVVTELPYLVGPEKVIEKVKDQVQAKRLQGIADITDLTDREHGLRLVIEVKGGFNPEAVLEQLYRLTPMEDSFGINNVALVEGQPRTLGLRELLKVYVDHRLDVVRRRTAFRRLKATERLHLVDGLLVAILDIDEVIAVIRSSDDTAMARERLMSVFDLTQTQTDYILEMPLRRLTKFSRIELEKEKSELERTIEQLTAVLDQPALLRALVSDELAEVSARFGTPRRTVLLESAGVPVTKASTTPLEVSDDPCWVLLSSTGLLARTTTADPLPAPDPGRRANHDLVVSAVRATARGEVAAVTSQGRMLRLPVIDMPALPPTTTAPTVSGGAPAAEFLTLAKGERLLGLCSLRPDSPGLALGTAQGVVKRVSPEYPSNRDTWEVLALKDGDEVVGAVELVDPRSDLVFITSDAQLLRFGADKVRPQGRAAGGMAGVNLAPRARVVFFGAVDLTGKDGEWGASVVTVSGATDALPGTQPGMAKVTPFAEYPAKGRATGGVRCHRFLKGEDVLLLGWAGTAPPRAAAANGVGLDLPPVDSRRDGSGTPLTQPVHAVAGAVGQVSGQVPPAGPGGPDDAGPAEELEG
jgi:DNA gyrase subunit A